ncbi:GNAT family N-acetyltransferase [Salirhabdus sp. Marseille-P4669]|uniref:GNAT family N-acetyltransferase n=1 Tax=Salirhabdus sp. Marseille-P4669 TaxID=2042310 RepID=UPI000C7DFB12|nr:GNAT family N-acetyltransferase [Salirhabdus sp. Marseille-P4669]
MHLNTKRLKLVPCTEKLLSALTNEDYQIGPHIQGYINELKDDSTLYGWGVWLIYNNKTNALIGDIGFKGKAKEDHSVEIGYGIMPTYQGKGYATEAVAALIKWAFSHNNIHKIKAECLIVNHSSIRVLQKLGFDIVSETSGMYHWELKD